MIHHVKRATRLLIFWSLIGGAIGLTSVRVLLSELENYKTEFEEKIYDTSGIQLRINALRAGTRGFNPEIILQGIDILSVDESGQPAVKLKELRIGVDLFGLLFSGDLLSSCRFTLVGVDAAVMRQEDGQITIKGLGDSKEQPLWLFQGGKYEILQSDISWLDRQRDGRPVIFTGLDAVLKNYDGYHEIHLLSRLPSRYGDSFRLSAKVSGNLLKGKNIAGQVFIAADNVHYSEAEPIELPGGFSLQRAGGSFQLWSHWRNSKPYRINTYVHNADLKMRRHDGEALGMEKLSGYLGWTGLDDAWRLTVRDLMMSSGGKQWPLIEFYLAGNRHEAVSAWITWLDLQEISYLSDFFLAPELREKLPKDLNVTGILNDFAIYLEPDANQFAVNGAFSELSVASSDNAPQLKGVSGQILGSRQQGQLLLASGSGSVAFPDLFRESIMFDRLAGKVGWRQDEQALVVDSDYVVLDNADLVTYSQFNITVPKDDAPASMELQTAFKGVSDVPRVPPYLPVGIMGKEVVEWLDHAFLGGKIVNGAFQFSGLLDEFPFTGGQGKFEVLFDVENGILSYQPDWPLLTELNANVHFFANSLQVNVKHAKSENVRVEQAVVEIPVLDGGDYLTVDGVVRGKIDDGLKFMQKTPLHTRVDGLVKAADVKGGTSVDLKLRIPLEAGGQEKVHGVIHVNNADMSVKSIALPLKKLTGNLIFTEQGLFCEKLNAQTLGFPVQAVIDTDPEKIKISAAGKSDMENIRRQFPFLHNDFSDGDFDYSVQLNLPVADNQPPSLQIISDLRGVTVDLPEPLMKTAEQTREIKIGMNLTEGRWLPLVANYGDELNLTFQIDTDKETLHAGHIVFGKGLADKREKAGLTLDINQKVFNLLDWQGLFSGAGDGLKGLPALDRVDVNVDQLHWGEQALDILQLNMQRNKHFWQGEIKSSFATGAMQLPVNWGQDETLKMRMVSLDLSKISTLTLPGGDKPERVVAPLLDIESERVLWRDINLGKLKLESENRQSGVHFKTVKLSGQDSVIDLSGDWLQLDDGSQSQIHGSLRSDDFGRFLGRLGFNDDLKETEAVIDVSGHWPGAPQRFSLSEFAGDLNINLSEGRISSIEPGFGRLLGLIAMEQWGKRFTLDFSDVYQSGLAFDSIKGRFAIAEGDAVTDDLLIDAVSARVKIKGSADLTNKTLDLSVLVLPKSSGAVPIAGTIVGGIASIVTQVLTDDYQEGYFFGSGYKISGSWSDPQVTPLHDRDGLVKKTWNGLTDFPWLNFDEN